MIFNFLKTFNILKGQIINKYIYIYSSKVIVTSSNHHHACMKKPKDWPRNDFLFQLLNGKKSIPNLNDDHINKINWRKDLVFNLS